MEETGTSVPVFVRIAIWSSWAQKVCSWYASPRLSIIWINPQHLSTKLSLRSSPCSKVSLGWSPHGKPTQSTTWERGKEGIPGSESDTSKVRGTWVMTGDDVVSGMMKTTNTHWESTVHPERFNFFHVSVHLSPTRTLWGRYYHHFTDGQTKEPREWISCPRSHSY